MQKLNNKLFLQFVYLCQASLLCALRKLKDPPIVWCHEVGVLTSLGVSEGRSTSAQASRRDKIWFWHWLWVQGSAIGCFTSPPATHVYVCTLPASLSYDNKVRVIQRRARTLQKLYSGGDVRKVIDDLQQALELGRACERTNTTYYMKSNLKTLR